MSLGQSNSTFTDIVSGISNRFKALLVSSGIANAGQIFGLNASGVADASLLPSFAYYQNYVATVTAPTPANTFVQAGLAVPFTPKVTGKVLVLITMQAYNSGQTGAGYGIGVQGSYGTGSAPAVNATARGTVFGQVASWIAATAIGGGTVGDVNEQIFFKSTIQFTVGTTYWIDLQQQQTNVKYNLNSLDITVIEFL
jgi:hypothetical protein